LTHRLAVVKALAATNQSLCQQASCQNRQYITFLHVTISFDNS